jgi:hypothetical protein
LNSFSRLNYGELRHNMTQNNVDDQGPGEKELQEIQEKALKELEALAKNKEFRPKPGY